MSFYQTIYDTLRTSDDPPRVTALVVQSRAAGRRLLAALAAHCGPLLGVKAETPLTLARELCAPALCAPGAPRLMNDDEAAELLLGCIRASAGLFSAKSAGTLGAVREIARDLRMLEEEGVPPLTAPGKQAALQVLRAAYREEKKTQGLLDRSDLLAMAIKAAERAENRRLVTLPDLRFTALEHKLLAALAGGAPEVVPLALPEGAALPWLPADAARADALARRNGDNTRILACMGGELEIERILRDMTERGLRFDACAVAYPSAACVPLLYETAGRMGIPAAFTAGIPIRQTRLYAALGLISQLRRRFSEAEDLRALLLRFGCMSDARPHALARAMRDYRVGWGDRDKYMTFLDQYQQELRAQTDGQMLTQEDAEARIALSERWRDWLNAVFTLSEPGEATLEEQKEAMALLLGGCRKAAAAERSAQATAAECARNVRTLPEGMRLLDWVLQLLDGKNVLSGSAAPGMLLCLPLQQALTSGREHLYVPALGRDVFAPGTESPVLLDKERAALRGADGCALPLRRDSGEEKRLRLLELLLHHPGDVTLSYSCFDCDKQIGLIPTQIVDTLRRRTGEETIPFELCEFIPKDGTKPLAAPDVFLKAERTRQCYPTAKADADGEAPQLAEEKDFAAALDEFIFSSTSMELALRCPLAFYYQYMLHETKPEYPIWKMEEWLPSNIIGSFCHRVLELYFGELAAKPEPDETAREALLKRILDSEWATLERRSPPPGLHGQRTKDAAFDMIRRAVDWTEDEGRTVLVTEQDFGPKKQRAELTLRAGKQSFRFQGSIDRVDRKRDGSYSVVDYKTGDPERLERQRAYHLQHYLYKAAERTLSEGKISPAEAGYLLLGDGECRFFTRDEQADKDAEKAIEALLTALKTDPALRRSAVPWEVEDGELKLRELAAQEEEASGCRNYCSYRALCPLAGATEKGGDEA